MKRTKPTKFQTFLLICLGLFAIHRMFFRAPSEADMIVKFKTHKAEFEQIRLMLQQDKHVQAVDFDSIRAEWDERNNRDFPVNLSANRLKLYRTLLHNLGVLSVASRHKEIIFYQFGGGFTDTSWSIGYSWLEKTPQFLVKSAYYSMPGQNKCWFSRLEGNWYIYNRR